MGAMHYGRGAWIVIRAGAIILVLTVARTPLTLWVFYYRAVSDWYLSTLEHPGRQILRSAKNIYPLRGLPFQNAKSKPVGCFVTPCWTEESFRRPLRPQCNFFAPLMTCRREKGPRNKL
jgi:hypothetical protein